MSAHTDVKNMSPQTWRIERRLREKLKQGGMSKRRRNAIERIFVHMRRKHKKSKKNKRVLSENIEKVKYFSPIIEELDTLTTDIPVEIISEGRESRESEDSAEKESTEIPPLNVDIESGVEETDNTPTSHIGDTEDWVPDITITESEDLIKLFAPTFEFKVATYNTRSLAPDVKDNKKFKNSLREVKLELLISHARIHGIQCMGLQECRRPEGIEVCEEYTCYWSGRKRGGHYGVGIILKTSLARYMKVVIISERTILLVGRINGMPLTLFSGYAPTGKETYEGRVGYSNQLSMAINKVDKIYRKNIIGFMDTNSNIGSYSEEWKEVRGQYVDENKNMNDSGLILLEFCVAHDMVLGNTFHKNKRYTTWSNPSRSRDPTNDMYYNTLDYVLVSKSLQENLVSCGVDLEFDPDISDHVPVVAVLKLYSNQEEGKVNKKKQIDRKAKPTRPPQVSLLLTNPEVYKSFKSELEKNLSGLTNWKDYGDVSKAIRLSMKKLPRGYRRKDEEWFPKDRKLIDKLIVERSRLRKVYILSNSPEDKEECTKMKSTMQRTLRELKNKHYRDRSEKIEYFFKAKETHNQFEAMKGFIKAPKKRFPEFVLRSDGISMTVDSEETKTRVTEYTKDLLNQVSVIDNNIEDYLPPQRAIRYELDIAFTMDELKQAIRAMKNNKACGKDDIPIEILKHVDSDILRNTVLEVWNECLNTGMVHSDLKDAIIQMVHKKDSVVLLTNYRTLSMTAHIGKGLEKACDGRLRPFAEETNLIPETQNGFRNKRSTVDSIFVSQMVSAISIERHRDCIKAFLDFKKAYDRVNQQLLWIILHRRGVPPKLLGMIRAMHEGSMAQVNLGGLSEPFFLLCGLKQGAILAPLLFNIYIGAMMEEIIRRVLEKGLGMKFRCRLDIDIFQIAKIDEGDPTSMLLLIWNVLFADDVAIMAEDTVKLQAILDIFVEVSTMYGQMISIEKSEILAVIGNILTPKGEINITALGHSLKNVNKYRYLGQLELSHDCRFVPPPIDRVGELGARSQSGWGAYFKLRIAVFENKDLHIEIKLLVYKVVVVNAILYACETWNMTPRDFASIEHIQMQILKRIFRVRGYHNRVSYLDLIMLAEYYKVTIYPLEILIQQRRLRYLGEIERMNDDRLCRQLLHSDRVDGYRFPGGQPVNYRGNLKKDLKAFEIDPKKWSEIVKCEEDWKQEILTGKEKRFKSWIRSNISESTYSIGQKEITVRGGQIKKIANDMLAKRKFPQRGRVFQDTDVTSRRKTRQQLDNSLDIDLSDLCGTEIERQPLTEEETRVMLEEIEKQRVIGETENRGVS